MSTIKVAYLGPPGTYSQQFDNVEDYKVEYFPQPSIASCFKAIDNNECDYSLVPFENSSNGQVVLSYDLFRDWYINKEKLLALSGGENTQDIKTPDFSVIGEQFVSINHNFITFSSDLTKINKIYSHPQVWSQCNMFLNQHELDNSIKIQKIDTSSTSKAVEIVAKLRDDPVEREQVAAIASATASKIHNVPIQSTSIEDIKGNTTRFLVLGRTDLPKTGNDKTTKERISLLCFVIKKNDDFGSLCDILEVFKKYDLNLQTITTRPSVISPWRYVFFVEVWESEKLKDALNSLDDLVLDYNVIGSFPRNQRFFDMIKK
ncbi:hypothetical protein B5S31_g2607 [[Candida] boidinii]|nr:hypothetical protein B5S31_g2607 [[Candida] boidinii]GME68652.1 unnamed protein product [[Candida] boidinii]